MSHHFEVVPPRAELVLHVLEDEREVGNTVDLAVDYSDSCSVPEADPSSTFAAAEEDKWNDVPAEVVVPVLEHASHGSAPASDQLGGPAVPGTPSTGLLVSVISYSVIYRLNSEMTIVLQTQACLPIQQSRTQQRHLSPSIL